MQLEDVELLFEGRRFRVVRQVQSFNDRAPREREIVRHPGAVAILPLVDEDRICLLRSFRSAVGEELIEIPAGTLEPGEDPQHTAARELAEETGYRAGRLQLLTSFFTSPGILDERMYLFLATTLEAGSQQLDPGEQIETFLATWDEALAMIGDGRIHDAKTLAALLYYGRFRR